jgi:hypothetical protein
MFEERRKVEKAAAPPEHVDPNEAYGTEITKAATYPEVILRLVLDFSTSNGLKSIVLSFASRGTYLTFEPVE